MYLLIYLLNLWKTTLRIKTIVEEGGNRNKKGKTPVTIALYVH
jgi:hypothetical protein